MGFLEQGNSKIVTWASSDEGIVTVSMKVVVTVIKDGTSTITVITSNDKKDTCTVNVWSKTSNVSFVKNKETRVDITWKEVPGDLRYTVFRKVDAGSCRSLKSGVAETTFTDTSATSYTYKDTSATYSS